MELDRMMREVAGRQHGVISRAQARGLGADRHHLRRRTESPDWEVVTTTVIRLVGTQQTFRQRCMTAVLDVGPGTAVSHESAATLWRLPGFEAGPVHVTRAVGRSGRRSTVATVHGTCHLPDHHVRLSEGVPVTSPARTVFDLAGVLHPGRTERALDNALARGVTTVQALRAVTDDLAGHGRPGSALMRRLLEDRKETYVPPESGLEARFLAILSRAGLPAPQRQVDVGGEAWAGRADFVYPDRRLVVEIDSDIHHTTVVDREADAQRDAALRAAGYVVVRIGEDLLRHRPEEVVRLLKAS